MTSYCLSLEHLLALTGSAICKCGMREMCSIPRPVGKVSEVVFIMTVMLQCCSTSLEPAAFEIVDDSVDGLCWNACSAFGDRLDC